MNKPDSKLIIQDMLTMEDRRQEAIEALLKESAELKVKTAARQEEIAADLKALGYKRPRQRKAKVTHG